MTRPEIYSLLNDHIGVDSGYLRDFTYRTHQEFYPYYCDLDIDPLTHADVDHVGLRLLHRLRDVKREPSRDTARKFRSPNVGPSDARRLPGPAATPSAPSRSAAPPRPDATPSRFARQSNRQQTRFVIHPTIEANRDSPESSHA